VETFELSEDHRITVEQDAESASINPREDWDQATGFVKVPDRGDSRLTDVPAVHEPEIPVLDAYYRFHGRGAVYYTDVLYRRRQRAEELTVRWAKIFHGTVLDYDHEHGGFWFVAGAIANSPETQAEVIKSEQKVYADWASGEVYVATLERAVEWARVGVEEETMITWESVDSMGGIYANPDWVVGEDVAAYFALTYVRTDLSEEEIEAARKLVRRFVEAQDS
jgi:hypothetical protein